MRPLKPLLAKESANKIAFRLSGLQFSFPCHSPDDMIGT